MPLQPRKNFMDYQDISRPYSAMGNEFARGEEVSHQHKRAQLVCAEEGILEIRAANKLSLLPPQMVFWIPPGVHHGMTALSRVKTKSFFIDPMSCLPEMPSEPKTLNATPLLRELLIRAATIEPIYDEQGLDGSIMELVLKEIDWNASDSFSVGWPRDPRLRTICSGIKESPNDLKTLEQWGELVGATSRTLARKFRQETGMPFSLWRQHMRVLKAQSLLLEGASVTEVALAVGYETPSSFSTVFLRITGRQPHLYRDLSD